MTPKMKLDQNERNGGAPAWTRSFLENQDETVFWQYPKRIRAEETWADFMNCKPSELVMTNGSDEAIATLFGSLKANTPVVLPLPAFGVFIHQCNQWPVDARLLPPGPKLCIDGEAVERQLEEIEDGLLVITRPNNPTGECMSKDRLRKWIELAAKRGNRVLLDEAYAEFSNQTCVDWIHPFSNLLVMRTLSKAYGLAGFRIGLLFGSAELVSPIRERLMPFNLSSPAVELACAATQPEAQMDVSNYTQQIRANRSLLQAALEEWGVDVCASEANFLLLRLGSPRNTLVQRFLSSQGIAVRLFDRPELEGTLRITVPLYLTELMEPLAKILKPDLICLDVDGCLMDVSSSFDQAIVETVSLFSDSPPEAQEITELRMTSGFNNDFELSRELLRRRGYDLDLPKVTQVFERCYWGEPSGTGACSNETPLVSESTMDFLYGRFKTALVTGRNRAELEPVLQLQPFKKIDFLVSVDDVTKGKPDPEGILKAQKTFNTRRTWMVGDNVDDILAGKASGSVTLGIGLANQEALYRAGADMVLEHIDEIRRLL